ncbi:MAG TPA: signal peptidase I [Gemmatimonadales bacterium]|nr:signal peptidase I [Gemmatimonadales bacterium]
MSAPAPAPAPRPTPPPHHHATSFWGWVWDWTKSIAVALVVWFLLRSLLVEPFRIPSGSMENTLLIGDWLFVNKAIYGAEVPFTHYTLPAARDPERNDILVFDSVEEEGLKVVKRLVGIPGDTLAMRHGRLLRNGQPVAEPYVLHEDLGRTEQPIRRVQMREWQLKHLAPGVDEATYQPDLQDWGPIVVPPDSFFMMGDNRENSYDSRYWGFLPRQNVRGRPMFVYYSYDAESWKPLPALTAIRWGRIGHVIR